MIKRKQKFVKPSLQWKCIAAFFSAAALAVLVQSVVLHYALIELAESVPSGRLAVIENTPKILLLTMGVTFAVLGPVTLLVGATVTARVAGPLVAMERFLVRTGDGENPPDLSLRKNDELQEFASLLNAVTAPLRASGERTTPASEDRQAA